MNQPVEGLPPAGVDARTDRVAQGVIGVALLAAFVFRIPWIVPALALLLAVAALAGPKADAIHLVFERWIAPRLPASREMARDLGLSRNTVKTHVARVYEKLEVQRRVQAIEKARWLALIP